MGVCDNAADVREVVRRNLQLLRKEEVTPAEAVRVFVNFGATIADYVAVEPCR